VANFEVTEAPADANQYVFSVTAHEQGHTQMHTITMNEHEWQRFGQHYTDRKEFITDFMDLLYSTISRGQIMERIQVGEVYSFYPRVGEGMEKRFT